MAVHSKIKVEGRFEDTRLNLGCLTSCQTERLHVVFDSFVSRERQQQEISIYLLASECAAREKDEGNLEQHDDEVRPASPERRF